MHQTAAEGRAALENHDQATFMRCVDRNLDLRAELFELQSADRALVDLGRTLGCAAKLPGSGGAVLFACPTPERLQRLNRALAARGVAVLAPNVARPAWIAR